MVFIANLGGIQSYILLILTLFVSFLDEFWASQKIMNNILKFREHLKITHPQQYKMLKLHLRGGSINGELARSKTTNMEVSSVKPEIIQDLSLQKNKSYIDFNEDCEKTKNDAIKVESSIEMTERNQDSSSIDINLEKKSRAMTKHHLNIHAREGKLMEKSEEKILSASKKPLNFSCIDIFFRFCPCKTKKLNLKNKFYEKASKKMEYYFDIFTYIKKMQEIDIIKYLLLDQDQIKLLNFISKPSVSMNYSDSDDIYSNIQKKRMNN